MNFSAFPSFSPHFTGLLGQSQLTGLLGQWVVMLPVLVVFLGGMIVALVLWTRCPRAAVLALISLSLMSALALTQPVAASFVMQSRIAEGLTSEQIGNRLMGVAVLFNLLRAVGYGLLIAAVFIARPPVQAAYSAVPTDPRIL